MTASYSDSARDRALLSNPQFTADSRLAVGGAEAMKQVMNMVISGNTANLIIDQEFSYAVAPGLSSPGYHVLIFEIE